jgi:hypothetical protein
LKIKIDLTEEGLIQKKKKDGKSQDSLDQGIHFVFDIAQTVQTPGRNAVSQHVYCQWQAGYGRSPAVR